jgi:hypothetical protein
VAALNWGVELPHRSLTRPRPFSPLTISQKGPGFDTQPGFPTSLSESAGVRRDQGDGPVRKTAQWHARQKPAAPVGRPIICVSCAARVPVHHHPDQSRTRLLSAITQHSSPASGDLHQIPDVMIDALEDVAGYYRLAAQSHARELIAM